MARVSRIKSASGYKPLQTARVLVLIFSIIFILTGALFVLTGVYAQVKMDYLINLLKNSDKLSATHLTPVFLIIIGIFIALTAILGFISATNDNVCVINCFCLLLSTVMIIEIVGGAMACIFLKQFKFAVESGMNNQLVNFNENSTLNAFQSNLGCCGVTSYMDYNQTSLDCQRSIFLPHKNINIPTSCCMEECPPTCTEIGPTIEAKVSNETESDEIRLIYYMNGCTQSMFGEGQEVLHYLIAITVALMTIQIVGILFTVCLVRRLKVTLNTAY